MRKRLSDPGRVDLRPGSVHHRHVTPRSADLVDNQSRVGELDTPFYNRLLDENATCHIAYGNSILGAFEDLPEGLSDDALRDMGVNRAHVHTDLMIGSNEVEVDGLHAGGDAVPLLRGGDWQLA